MECRLRDNGLLFGRQKFNHEYDMVLKWDEVEQRKRLLRKR